MNAIYCRVSTEDQARKGYSLDDQRRACRKHLETMNLLEIEEYIDNGYSGEFLERPGLEKLRKDLRSGAIKYIAIYDPDRLSRNLTNQLIIADEIEKSGAILTFVTGDYDCSPEGRLFFSMKGAIAAYEKAKIRERTCRGRRSKAYQGKIVSNAHPFGFDWDKDNSMYKINDQEAEIIRTIYCMCLTKGWGARKIALELARTGIKGRAGRPLSVSTISRILNKEMYCGTHYLFRQSVRKTGQNTREIKNNTPDLWVKIEIPAIVSRKDWEMAQEQANRNKKLSLRNTKHNYLLRGLIRCAACGHSMIAYTRSGKRKNGPDKTYSYYSCITKESNSYATSSERCICRRIPAQELDCAVWNEIVKIALSGGISTAKLNYEQYNYHDQLKILTARQSELQLKQADIARWYRSGLIGSATAETELTQIDKELSALHTEISSIRQAAINLDQPDISPAVILHAKVFHEKRDVLLSIPYHIEARRTEDLVEFWLCENNDS